MTHVGAAPISSSAVSTDGASFVEWGAVLAGAALAAAISFVLLSFGAGIGLSATSPWPNSGASAKVIASVAIFWAMAQQIGAFMVGGYIAGRMRSRWHEAGHEVEFRDGLHGGLVWAVGVIIGAALFLSAAGSVAKIGTEIAGGATAFASTASNDPMDAVLDAMIRPITVAQASSAAGPAGAAPPAASAATAPRARAAMSSNESRAEMARVLSSSVANGTLTTQNRVYLAQVVSQQAGISQQEAERRVDEAFNAARVAADKARRAGILTAFVTAASLVLSLGAAWWAALKGGHHRDNSIPARFEFGQRPRHITPTA
jgi:hypothetical protein